MKCVRRCRCCCVVGHKLRYGNNLPVYGRSPMLLATMLKHFWVIICFHFAPTAVRRHDPCHSPVNDKQINMFNVHVIYFHGIHRWRNFCIGHNLIFLFYQWDVKGIMCSTDFIWQRYFDYRYSPCTPRLAWIVLKGKSIFAKRNTFSNHVWQDFINVVVNFIVRYIGVEKKLEFVYVSSIDISLVSIIRRNITYWISKELIKTKQNRKMSGTCIFP